MKRRILQSHDFTNVYENLSFGYTLRKILHDDIPYRIADIIRSSDNQKVSLFFDSNDKISLNSFVSSTTASNIPSATTLGVWAGLDDVYVYNWFPISNDNTYPYDYYVATIETTSSGIPLLVNGVLNEKNGLASLYFNGSRFINRNNTISSLDSGNEFTIIVVSSNELSNSLGVTFSNTNTQFDRISVYNDRSIDKYNSLIRNNTTPYSLYNISQYDNNSLSFNTLTVDSSKNMRAYRDGVLQDTGIFTGSYSNNYIRIGNQFSNTSVLDGYISEVLIFSKNEYLNGNLDSIHDDIKSFYSI